MLLQTTPPAQSTLDLVPFQPDHILEVSRIVYEAFFSLQSRHVTHIDIPDLETAQMLISHIVSRPDYTGVMATIAGQIIGSNFLLHADEVAGVGPITVNPHLQSRGVGRSLMEWVIDAAHKRGIRQIRLFQEAVNTTSLSLYTSVGFTWRDSATLMQAAPAAIDHPAIRPLTAADLPSIEALSSQAYGFSRAGDAAQVLAAGFPGFALEEKSCLTGYYIASLFGHACAATDHNLLALVGHAARHLPPSLALFICPFSREALFRQCLAAGHRTLKVLSYMSYGDFVAPPGAYLPSIQC